MGAYVVGNATLTTPAVGTTLVVNLPTAVQVGDILYMGTFDPALTAGSSPGWTLLDGTQGGNNTGVKSFYRIVDAAYAAAPPATSTWTFPASNMHSGTVVIVRGASTVPSDWTKYTFTYGSVSSVYYNNPNTYKPGEVMVYMMGKDNTKTLSQVIDSTARTPIGSAHTPIIFDQEHPNNQTYTGATVHLNGACEIQTLFVHFAPLPPPTLSNLSPTNGAAVSRTGSTTFTWDTTGNAGMTYVRSEIRHRVRDSSGAFTVVTSTTRGSVPVTGTSFGIDGEEYEITAQDFYTQHNSSNLTGFITSGNNPWIYLSEVTSATASGTITGLTDEGNYSVGVRTSDASSFGPYSTSTTFVVPPASNTYVRVSGAWVVKPRFARVAGVMKPTGRVKVKVGGSFV